MLRKYLILEDGVEVVIDDEIDGDGYLVMGFLRRGEGKRGKALCRVRVTNPMTVENDGKAFVMEGVRWEIAVGFTMEELADLHDFLGSNVRTLCCAALDKETTGTLDIAE